MKSLWWRRYWVAAVSVEFYSKCAALCVLALYSETMEELKMRFKLRKGNRIAVDCRQIANIQTRRLFNFVIKLLKLVLNERRETWTKGWHSVVGSFMHQNTFAHYSLFLRFVISIFKCTRSFFNFKTQIKCCSR